MLRTILLIVLVVFPRDSRAAIRQLSPAFAPNPITKSVLTPSSEPTNFVKRSTVTALSSNTLPILNALAPNDQAVIPLNLFHDWNFTAVIRALPQSGCASRVFKGRIQGREDSVILIATRSNVFAATVIVPGLGVAKIRPAGDGFVEIAELSQTDYAMCGVAADSRHVSPLGLGIGTNAPVSTSGSTNVVVAPPVVADLLVVYSSQARVGAGGKNAIETLIDLAIAEANLCYANSRISLRVNLAGTSEVTYAETGNLEKDLGILANRFDGNIDNVHDLRDQFQADMVTLIVESEDSNTIAGIANFMTFASSSFADSAFSVLRRPYLTGNFTLAHELGHNMGCSHDRDNANVLGSYAYSYGYRFTADGVVYRTVMAANPGLQIPYFSNPDILFLGVPIGVPEGLATAADNSKTVNTNSAIVSSFRVSPPRIEFSRAQLSVMENAGTATLEIQRSGNLSPEVSAVVSLQSVGAPAAAVVGFQNTQITFPSGVSQVLLPISIADDGVTTGSRSLSFVLQNVSSNAIPGSTTNLVVTIFDDEQARLSLLDFSFMASGAPDYRVDTIAVQADGMIIIGGTFNSIGGVSRPRIARLNGAGAIDATYQPGRGAKYGVLTSQLQPDQKLLIGGQFNLVTGTNRARIARLNTSGLNDATFDPGTGVDDFVFSISQINSSPTNSIAIAGRFRKYNETIRTRIAKLNFDGTLDSTFDPGLGPDDTVQSVIIQPDSKVLIAGRFTNVSGIARGHIARLNANGSLDTSFDPGTGTDAAICSMVIQSDGSIVAGGAFTNANGVPHARLARWNATGALDPIFRADADDTVQTLLSLPSGNLIVGGDFLAVNGKRGVRVARLRPDGSVDESFVPPIGPDDTVISLALQADGRVLIGGLFQQVDGVDRPYVARLLPGAPAMGVPSRIVSVERASQDIINLTIQTRSDRSSIVQSSPDLSAWIPIQTNAPSTSTLNLSVTLSFTNKAQYFRVIQPNP